MIARKLAIALESSCGGRGRCCTNAGRGVVAEGKRPSPPARSDHDAFEASSSSEVVSSFAAAGAGGRRALGFGKTSETGGPRLRSGDCLRRFPEAIQDTQGFLFCVSSGGS